ncbi:conjugal transfer protein [Lachnospiraceae bacterium]|nr:conjugal transfer protein [Lachnospiraceae bacterium]
MNERTKWIYCPVCRSKTRDRIREDTILINYPLYCPKCKQETLIEILNLKVTVITEPDTLDAEPMNL